MKKEWTNNISDNGKLPTILMAEDDNMVRKLNVAILSRLGYRVIDAMDGLDALDKFEGIEDSIDLLMTDIMMPGMDGTHLAEKMREVRPDLKIIYNSGFCDDEIFNGAEMDDRATFIAKPYQPDTLARKIKDLLDR